MNDLIKETPVDEIPDDDDGDLMDVDLNHVDDEEEDIDYESSEYSEIELMEAMDRIETAGIERWMLIQETIRKNIEVCLEVIGKTAENSPQGSGARTKINELVNSLDSKYIILK